jgi:hypothetical protein
MVDQLVADDADVFWLKFKVVLVAVELHHLNDL